jgi:hypothetical protein
MKYHNTQDTVANKEEARDALSSFASHHHLIIVGVLPSTHEGEIGHGPAE